MILYLTLHPLKHLMSAQVKLWQSIAVTLLISALTGALGYSVSQMQLAKTVAVQGANIEQLKTMMSGYEARSSQHMSEAIDLFKEQAKSQSEFIAVLRVQNELLGKLYK